MNLSDLEAVQRIAAERIELLRVLAAIDRAESFRVVMTVPNSADVSCPLPQSYIADLQTVIQKQINALNKDLRDLDVKP